MGKRSLLAELKDSVERIEHLHVKQKLQRIRETVLEAIEIMEREVRSNPQIKDREYGELLMSTLQNGLGYVKENVIRTKLIRGIMRRREWNAKKKVMLKTSAKKEQLGRKTKLGGETGEWKFA